LQSEIASLQVPDTFCVLRAESKWTSETAGGQADLSKNPQLLMKVSKKTDITISMNQPDIRMKYKHMGAAGKAHFDRTWAQPDEVCRSEDGCGVRKQCARVEEERRRQSEREGRGVWGGG
jgi:hypothetical protein